MSLSTKINRQLILMQIKQRMQKPTEELVTLGSEYGANTVPKSALKPGAVAICAGAGEDVTFDVELNNQGLIVYCLDPTPRAVEHVDEVLAAAKEGRELRSGSGSREPYSFKGFDPSRFIFQPRGIWSKDETLRFYAPKSKESVSCSVKNLEETGEHFDAECVTLETMEKEIGKPIDILKLDIMGAEYDVIRYLVSSSCKVPVLCVELDECQYPNRPGAKKRLFEILDWLGSAGYKFVHLRESNATFVR